MLQHGLTQTLEDWRDFGYSDALRNDYQLILIDARGHGNSDKPHEPEAYSGKIMVEDVAAVLDDMNVSKAHYWGFSMGGGIGFNIAKYAPERFNALILGGVSPYLGRTEMAEFLDQLSQVLEAGMEVLLALYEEAAGQPLPLKHKARLLANDPQALTSALQGIRTSNTEDIVPTIALPCLVYAGEADPNCTGARNSAEQMTNATFISFPGLDHAHAFVRSDLVLPHATKFLKEVGG